MVDSIQIVVALILYLILFGWIGYRRGSLRELIVLFVSFVGYLVLRRYQNIVVTLINLFGRFIVFAQAGGLAGDDPDAILQLRDAPNILDPAQGSTVIFLFWVLLLLAVYGFTGRFITNGRNRYDTTAIFLGMLNGIFYFSIFLPLLSSILWPAAGATLATDGAGLVLRSAWNVLGESFREFWMLVDQQQPLVVVLFLTLLLVLVASTLRGPSPRGGAPRNAETRAPETRSPDARPKL
jgi:hypothetical protein